MRALLLVAAIALPFTAFAQLDEDDAGSPVSIVPPAQQTQQGLYSTHPAAPPGGALPWQRPAAPAVAPKGYPPLPAQLPFARESGPAAYSPPAGPHATQAAPVGGVATGDVGEADVPAPAAATDQANPAAQNPATPDIQTSPIFPSDTSGPQPKKIVFRALNKVTGRSDLLEAKPGETVQFDRLDIQAVTCQQSLPNSQTDYAGLFDLKEHLPGQKITKDLFHGWMYASSPSITSLEHPIYDVTMVKCEMPEAAAPEKKPEKKKAK